MAYRLYKVSGYRLVTPKYHKGTKVTDDSFDIDILEYWFDMIEKLNKRVKTFKYVPANDNGKKTMYLDEVITNNSKYIYGKFKTGMYGTSQSFYNVINNEQTYEKSENESSDDDVFFFLYKSTGVLLFGKDPNYAINITSIRKYFKMFQYILEPFRNRFNKMNLNGPQIYKNLMIAAESLPPVDFFDELNNMTKIKEASFKIKKDDQSDVFDIIEELKSLDEKNTFDDQDLEVEISLRNISDKQFVKQFVRIFKIMNQDERYENFMVRGKHTTGNMRTIRNNMPIRTFEFNVDFGNKNFPIRSEEVESGFNQINDDWKILFGEVYKSKNVVFPHEVYEIKECISNEVKKINKKSPNLKNYRGKLRRKV